MTTKTKVQQTFDVEKGDTYSHALLILEKAGVITESRFRALLGVEDEEFKRLMLRLIDEGLVFVVNKKDNRIIYLGDEYE